MESLLKAEAEATGPMKMWFDGEWDSNQTRFEQMSNLGKIAVLAKTKYLAGAMLMILRIRIDCHSDNSLLDEYLDNPSKELSPYIEGYDPSLPITWYLCDNQIVKVTNPDLWTWKRLRKNHIYDICLIK